MRVFQNNYCRLSFINDYKKKNLVVDGVFVLLQFVVAVFSLLQLLLPLLLLLLLATQ